MFLAVILDAVAVVWMVLVTVTIDILPDVVVVFVASISL